METRTYICKGPPVRGFEPVYEVEASTKEKARWIAVERFLKDYTVIGINKTILAVSFTLNVKERKLRGSSTSSPGGFSALAKSIVSESRILINNVTDEERQAFINKQTRERYELCIPLHTKMPEQLKKENNE